MSDACKHIIAISIFMISFLIIIGLIALIFIFPIIYPVILLLIFIILPFLYIMIAAYFDLHRYLFKSGPTLPSPWNSKGGGIYGIQDL
jgi:hypothetical protein